MLQEAFFDEDEEGFWLDTCNLSKQDRLLLAVCKFTSKASKSSEGSSGWSLRHDTSFRRKITSSLQCATRDFLKYSQRWSKNAQKFQLFPPRPKVVTPKLTVGPRLHRYMDTEQRIHPGDMAAAVKEALVRSEAKWNEKKSHRDMLGKKISHCDHIAQLSVAECFFWSPATLIAHTSRCRTARRKRAVRLEQLDRRDRVWNQATLSADGVVVLAVSVYYCPPSSFVWAPWARILRIS